MSIRPWVTCALVLGGCSGQAADAPGQAGRPADSTPGPTRIQIGEGETMPGTVLYPGDSLRRVEIVWQDRWDYAGVVTDWKGGALDSSLAGVKLYLDPGPAQHESAPYSQVLGDRDYSSALPAMQQLAPRVGQIFVDFESP